MFSDQVHTKIVEIYKTNLRILIIRRRKKKEKKCANESDILFNISGVNNNPIWRGTHHLRFPKRSNQTKILKIRQKEIKKETHKKGRGESPNSFKIK